MYERDGKQFRDERQACVHLFLADGVLLKDNHRNVHAKLRAHGFSYTELGWYRRKVNRLNSKLHRMIRRFFRWLGKMERHF